MIWLVGSSDEWLESVNEVLSGFFGVRRIGSLKSLGRLIALGELPVADEFICIFRLRPADDLISIYSAISKILKACRVAQVVVVGELTVDQLKVIDNFGITFLGMPTDLVKTAKLLRILMVPLPQVTTQNISEEILRIGDIEIYRTEGRMRVLATGVDEPLTPKEIRILFVLSAAINKTISREELVKKVWIGTHVSSNTVDSHMSRLRKKIDQSFECRLETQYGCGWTLSMRRDSL
jgi:DNA-binding response OmpR family regulator